jgi:hypothetical protein
LFEIERIPEILTEQLSLYSEWIAAINVARHWFEEGKKTFHIIRSNASWGK